MTLKGTLPVGVEYDGTTHTDIEIREELLRDTVEVFDDPGRGERAEKNPQFFGACIYANRIVKLGTIPKEKITPELLLDMKKADSEELLRLFGRADKSGDEPGAGEKGEPAD